MAYFETELRRRAQNYTTEQAEARHAELEEEKRILEERFPHLATTQKRDYPRIPVSALVDAPGPSQQQDLAVPNLGPMPLLCSSFVPPPSLLHGSPPTQPNLSPQAGSSTNGFGSASIGRTISPPIVSNNQTAPRSRSFEIPERLFGDMDPHNVETILGVWIYDTLYATGTPDWNSPKTRLDVPTKNTIIKIPHYKNTLNIVFQFCRFLPSRVIKHDPPEEWATRVTLTPWHSTERVACSMLDTPQTTITWGQVQSQATALHDYILLGFAQRDITDDPRASWRYPVAHRACLSVALPGPSVQGLFRLEVYPLISGDSGEEKDDMHSRSFLVQLGSDPAAHGNMLPVENTAAVPYTISMGDDGPRIVHERIWCACDECKTGQPLGAQRLGLPGTESVYFHIERFRRIPEDGTFSK